MDERTPPLLAETEALKKFYAALNRNDIPAMLAALDPKFEWTDPAGDPRAATYRGLAEVKEHFARARATWAEGSCEPERFIVAGDTIVVLVHVRVRLEHRTEWIDARLGDVFTFRDGRILRARSFADRREALAWAGVETTEGDEPPLPDRPG